MTRRSSTFCAALAALLLGPVIGFSAVTGSVAPSAGAAPATPEDAPGPAAGTDPGASTAKALVRIRVATTSDWTTVTFNGHLAGAQLRSMSGSTQVRRNHNGMTLSSVGAEGAVIVVDAVLEETRPAAPAWVLTEKGLSGRTRIVVENRTATPQIVLDQVNDAPPTRDGRSVKAFTLSRDALFGTEPLLLPRPTTPRRVLAFYYPWFNDAVYKDPTLADRPTDRSDVWSRADVLSMSRQARSVGVDGFVVSWSGAAHDRVAFARVLQAARASDGVAAGILEVVAANGTRDPAQPADPVIVETWLRELLAASSHPAYLREEGTPVVFVYEMRRLPPPVWRDILDRLAKDHVAVGLIGDAGPAWANVTWGDYDYSPWADDQGRRPTDAIASDMAALARESRAFSATHPNRRARIVAATVFPGYDDRPSRGSDRGFISRDGTAAYQRSWDAALAADPDWVMITSWNEWWEGTGIQPSDRYGRAALDATVSLVARFKQ